MQYLLKYKHHIPRLTLGLIALMLIVSCKNETEEPIHYKLLEEDVFLESQQDVDDFVAQKITHIRGNLSLYSRSQPFPITDISGFKDLTTIEGSLTIFGTSITHVDAFSNLTRLDGELLIDFNEDLKNLDGFMTLGDSNRVFRTIRIRANPELTTIDQFNSVTEIEESLFIWNNASLTDLDFSGLRQANVVGFSGNSQLRDLRGLPNLKKVFQLGINGTSLTSLEGLESLEEASEIGIRENDQITAIDQFSQLTDVPNWISIDDNKALASLDFSNLKSAGWLKIHNSQLQDLSGFPALEIVDVSVVLTHNKLLRSLEGFDDVTIEGTLWLAGAQITSLDILEGFDLSGGLGIEESGITDLQGLEHVESMKYLWVLNNPQLTSFDGLENLSQVEIELSIEGNPSLKSLSGLQKLKRVERELSIMENPSLESLEGLNALERVERDLIIYNCASLTDFCALKLLTDDIAGVFVRIDENAYNPTVFDIKDGDCKL